MAGGQRRVQMRRDRTVANPLASHAQIAANRWDQSKDGGGQLRVQTANGLLTGLLTNCPRRGGTEQDRAGQRAEKSPTIRGFLGLEQTEGDGG
jgi:hypothetical protein